MDKKSEERSRHINQADIDCLKACCPGMPPLFVFFAAHLATSVNPSHEILKMCRAGNGLLAKLQSEPSAQKCEFYQSSWNILHAVLGEFGYLEAIRMASQ